MNNHRSKHSDLKTLAMAEALSPNPRQQKLPMASRLQSPTSPFFLGSNDDKLERAQARAARAAAIRRKSIAVNAPPLQQTDLFLGKEQILELFQNCIKLASENKINQKNTWELNLIDHLAEIIKVEEENEVETNFQKASCTLEAGVKIYSLRVDSVHSEAYKVLGGISRAGQESDEVPNTSSEDPDGGCARDNQKREADKKISPVSTLESTFEALNVKKFDAAFAVDPLYHQTSALFDEGGAKGLLLNNLGIYGGCHVLFDSLEVPGKKTQPADQCDISETIDLSFTKELIDQMMSNMGVRDEISPTLRDIVNQLDKDHRHTSDSISHGQKSADQVFCETNETELGGNVFEQGETYAFDNDDPSSVVDEFDREDPTCMSHHEETEEVSFNSHDMDDTSQNVDEYLFLSLGYLSKKNDWAGPDHWKYRKAKGSMDDSTNEKELNCGNKKVGKKKQAEPDIDFIKALDEEMPDIFSPPRNPKSLLLSSKRPPCNARLPEDCHYQPEDLVKLFLLPDVLCLGRRRRKAPDESRLPSDEYEPEPFSSWGDGFSQDGQNDDENDHSDVQDTDALVSQPRQVSKIDVQYDKRSKQVDVQELKGTLWAHIQQSPKAPSQGPNKETSFKDLLSSFPADCSAAASIEEISPHLCFICLLHLANEHGLVITGCSNMDDLSIYLPSSDSVQVM